MLRFIHLSDTHIGANSSFSCHGINTYDKFCRLIEYINSLAIPIDFVVHTGDLVGESSQPAYIRALRLLKDLRYPCYCIAGNYDDFREIQKLLPATPGTRYFGLQGSNVVEFSGYNLIFLNTSCYPVAKGKVAADDLDYLEQFLSSAKNPSLIFNHFPALPVDCPWIERDMLLENGRVFHDLLRNYQDTVKAVFHGHIHKGITHFQDGILYSSVPSTFCQYPAWPNNSEPGEEKHLAHAFNLVTVSNSSITIKECSF